MHKDEFQQLVWDKSQELRRDMPWRDEPTFYYVLVSEIMLQQTQVPRVLIKFQEFMTAFPTLSDLAAASLAEVLVVWSGLGYNRRAKFLHEAAKYVALHGEPSTLETLTALPGVGKNTAGAIMNYVYEIPTAFVETNIRTVYFHHFFAGEQDVTDKRLLEAVEQTMDREHPREWFWALMDYGTQLKSQGQGRLSVSRHYKKQAPLSGSLREMRGRIVRQLTHADASLNELKSVVQADERFDQALQGLITDGLVDSSADKIHLTR